MNPLLYFLPINRPTAERGDFRRLGIDYAWPDAGVSCVQCTNGPGGAGGLLVADARARGLAFRPDQQTWRKIAPAVSNPGPADGSPADGTPAAGNTAAVCYVGFWNDRRPGAADLVRRQVYDGNRVRLGGSEFIVPRCYAYRPVVDETGRASTLPMMLDLDDAGEIVGRVDHRYEGLWAGAMRFFQTYVGDPAAEPMDGREHIRLAVEALAVNYRIGLTEAVGLLKIGNSDDYGLVLRAMIDADEMDAWVERQAALRAADNAGQPPTDAPSAVSPSAVTAGEKKSG